MPCFHPQKAWRAPDGRVTFVRNSAFVDLPLTLKCGQCSGCRLEHSRQWAMRMYHEASLWPQNSFITLTYDDDNVPSDRSLDFDHWTLFAKRLRKKYAQYEYTSWINPDTGRLNHTRKQTHFIRFYMAGEYGELFDRPHYHACLFNHDFPDKVPLKTENGITLFTSAELETLWPYGFSSVGTLTFDSAAYCARYVMKKINGELADDHYFDSSTGVWRVPEGSRMSRGSGIGSGWFDQYHGETYRDDYIIINGHKVQPPQFYDKKYEVIFPEEMRSLKFQRKAKSRLTVDNNIPSRLKVREAVQKAKMAQTPRKLK